MRKILLGIGALIMTASGSTMALAEGDAAKGEAAYGAQCAFCHGTAEGEHKMGPSMAGIYGMKAGTTDFTKYVGLKNVDAVWDDASLDSFLADPKTFVGGPTSMMSTVKDAATRADIIAYLKTLK